MQSARSTEGLIEAARILSTLNSASSQAQGSAQHASNAAFAGGIAQQAHQRLQDTSERHQQHVQAASGSDRQNAGVCCLLLLPIAVSVAHWCYLLLLPVAVAHC